MLKKTFPKKKANFQEMFSFSLKFKNNSCVYLPGFEPDLNSKKNPCYTAKISVVLAVTYTSVMTGFLTHYLRLVLSIKSSK